MGLSAKDVILEYVCPALGVIVANIMFSAPYKSVKKAIARGYLGDLNPTPWAFMLGNTCGWIAYSFLLNNYWIFFGNCPGFLLSVWLNLVAAKLQCQDYRVKEMRSSFIALLAKKEDEEQQRPSKALEVSVGTNKNNNNNNNNNNNTTVITDWASLALQLTTQSKPAPAPHEKIVIGIVLFWVILLSTVSLGGKHLFASSTQEWIVGIAVNINLCFFYGGPLSTIVTVLREKNTASIHGWTMMTNTANGAFWTAYGIAVGDYFIVVPNGIGVVLGLVQFTLVLLLPRRRGNNDNDDDKQTDSNKSPNTLEQPGTIEEGI